MHDKLLIELLSIEAKVSDARRSHRRDPVKLICWAMAYVESDPGAHIKLHTRHVTCSQNQSQTRMRKRVGKPISSHQPHSELGKNIPQYSGTSRP